MTTHPSGFSVQYAVRTPAGTLYSKPRSEPSDVYASPAYDYAAREMLRGVFGPSVVPFDGGGGDAPVPQAKPLIFDTRADAENLLKQLREAAARVGVDHYGAAIVTRLCSPFTQHPTPGEFAAHVTQWLEQQP